MKMQSDGQALLTGTIIGSLARESRHLNVLDIQGSQDEDGKYRPYFEVKLPSGTYRVIVDQLSDGDGNGRAARIQARNRHG